MTGREIKGRIWDIKRYALHDGPGIRTTVFFKGCPLSCLWCCNPESQGFEVEIAWIRERCLGCGLCARACPREAVTMDPELGRTVDPDRCLRCGACVEVCPGEALSLMGRDWSVPDLLEEVHRDAVFFSRSGGGLTLSGGEPLAQAGFATALLQAYKTEYFGPHTTVETSGLVSWSDLERLARWTDLFLFDIKVMDPERHLRYTGVDNRLIHENARRLAESGKRLIVRLPLIPGINDDAGNVSLTAKFARSLPGVDTLDLLPYHRLGEPKYARLGREYPLAGTGLHHSDRLGRLQTLAGNFGLKVRLGG